MGIPERIRAVELAIDERRIKPTTMPPPLLQRAAQIAKFIESGGQPEDEQASSTAKPFVPPAS